MAKVRFDMVAESSTTTGTGNITLAGAKNPGVTFAAAGVATSDTFKYRISHDVNNEWEVGTGTLLTSTTFSRSVIASSNANALVSFSAGNKTVELVLDSADINQLGLALSTTEVNLGSGSVGGSFTIAGTGMPTGRPVLCIQAVGPYTGKGSLEDVAEEPVWCTAIVTSPTVITVYWQSNRPVGGNVKFNYQVG